MTFKEYVATASLRADGPGDVGRLARRDARLPEIGSLRDLEAYLRAKGLPETMVEHAAAAWSRYGDAVRRVQSRPVA